MESLYDYIKRSLYIWTSLLKPLLNIGFVTPLLVFLLMCRIYFKGSQIICQKDSVNRSHVQFNKIKPCRNFLKGYHCQNIRSKKFESVYNPTSDAIVCIFTINDFNTDIIIIKTPNLN